MKSTRKRLSALVSGTALTLAAALTLSACGGSSGDSAEGGVVIVTAAQPPSFSYESTPTGYEAAEFWLNTGATLIRNPYVEGTDGLAAHQELFKFEPVLAKSYDVSPDGKVITFELNTDAKSASGNSLDADDVVFSFKRKFEVDTSIVAFVSAPVITSPDQVKKIDDDTVTITIDDPAHGFTLLSLLSNQPYTIYDSDVLKAHATPDDPYGVEHSKTNADYGFGAYKLVSYTPGQQMVYEANPGYALGEPEVKKIVQRVVADAGQRSNLVKSGDAAIATQLRPADQVALSDAGAAQIFDVPSNAYVYVPLTTTKAPFDNVDVRRAFAHAVPYEAIMKDVYKGRLGPISSILNDTLPDFNGSGLNPNTFDPQKSLEILKNAGVSTPVKFELTINNAVPDLKETAVQIQTAARAAGFEITLNEVNSAVFQEGLAAKTFQASMGRDYAVVQSPPYVLSLFYTPGSPINWPDFDYAPLNNAIAAGNKAGEPLTPAAWAEWNKAERVLQDQMPTVYIGYVQPLNAFRNGLGGYVFRTDSVIDYSVLKP
ncbi:putative peptide ABC transporter substrate-binding protein [Gordonia paraffinivorans NBRC 108238]|uniref:Peptide ABC transporter substrate-binding protein n=1 Tax=Gordonia paraffinivorans NBRC 108238 TaxID=1223543 RepID=A0ABQ0INK6_9ACTN|nr:ABC transporter substrate-binding protein [Gordonia paraffinivorans]GAC85137.1 putative peptide ABC transporter substrate-binding protein [Gordonia paraffinivorans NBRC 108238]